MTTSRAAIDAAERRAGGRWAGWLFVAGGCIMLVNAALPGGTHVNHAVLAVMGVVAVAVGAVTVRLPWNSWSASASLVLAVLALALVAIANSFDDGSPYSYSVYYVLVFAWVGLFHPRWTSLRLAPVAGAAYVLPPLFAPGRDSAAVVTVAETLPVSIVVAEVIARAAEGLRRARGVEAGRVGDLDALIGATAVPQAEHDGDAAVGAIAKLAVSLLRVQATAVLLDDTSGSLVPVATYKWPETWPLAEFSPNEGDVARVIRTRHPVLLDRDVPAEDGRGVGDGGRTAHHRVARAQIQRHGPDRGCGPRSGRVCGRDRARRRSPPAGPRPVS